MNTQRLNRRTMLRGTGGALLALPYLDAMGAPIATSEVPMRMACVGLNFGFVPQLFFPEQTGRDYELTDRLKPLRKLRDDFTVFSGLDHGDLFVSMLQRFGVEADRFGTATSTLTGLEVQG